MELQQNASKTIPTRILILSDTHGVNFNSEIEPSFRLPCPKVDVVLHCGDLTSERGLEDHNEIDKAADETTRVRKYEEARLEEYQKTLRMLGTIDAELKLVIAGNHDVLLDKDFAAQQGFSPAAVEKAEAIIRGPHAQDAGVKYLDEGTHSFTLNNGASFTIYASPYQPRQALSLWGFQYNAIEDRYNKKGDGIAGVTVISTPRSTIPVFPEVDVVMTHGPPRGFLDEIDSHNIRGGCEHLWQAIRRAKPLLHCFGHIHRSWGAIRREWDEHETIEEEEMFNDNIVPIHPERINRKQMKENGYAEIDKKSEWGLVHGKETLFVNASIMDEKDEPSNSPWLITLNLRRRVEGIGEVAAV